MCYFTMILHLILGLTDILSYPYKIPIDVYRHDICSEKLQKVYTFINFQSKSKIDFSIKKSKSADVL